MDADFFRGVPRRSVDIYPKSGTYDEKLASRLVTDLRRNTTISVFRVGGDITELRIAAAIAATRQSAKPISYVMLDIGGYLAVPCEGNTPRRRRECDAL